MWHRPRRATTTISTSVLREAASSGAAIPVLIAGTGSTPTVGRVEVISIDDSTARIRRAGAEEVVDLASILDPEVIRRRVYGGTWLDRLLDRFSWLP